jgi:hypothetical protein
MTNDTNNCEIIDITPTWEAAVRIYLHVLRPSCDSNTLDMVTEDLMRLAKYQDNAIASAKERLAKGA